jgi:hypothetical protein
MRPPVYQRGLAKPDSPCQQSQMANADAEQVANLEAWDDDGSG